MRKVTVIFLLCLCAIPACHDGYTSDKNIAVTLENGELVFTVNDMRFFEQIANLSVYTMDGGLVGTAGVKNLKDKKISLKSNEHIAIVFSPDTVYKYTICINSKMVKGFFIFKETQGSNVVFHLNKMPAYITVYKCDSKGVIGSR